MRAAAASILALLALTGCTDPGSVVGFEEHDPAARFRATQKAAHDRDEAAIKPLILQLESDDAAERVFAIGTLERLTGQTLGYDHAAARSDRAVAVQRWVDWYNQRQQAPPRTADQ